MQPPASEGPFEPASSAPPDAGTFCFIDSDGYMHLVTDRSVIACTVTPWFRIQPVVGVAQVSDFPDLFGRVGLTVPPDAIAERSPPEELLRRQSRIVIPLEAILRMRLNDDNTGAAITWRQGSRWRTRTVRLPPLAPVGDFLPRLEFIHRIMSAGGRDPATAWQQKAVSMGWLRRVAPPLGGFVLLAMGASVVFDVERMLFKEPPNPARVQPLAPTGPWTFARIGLTVVAILGVACIAWLVSRLKQPMRETVLERVDGPDARS